MGESVPQNHIRQIVLRSMEKNSKYIYIETQSTDVFFYLALEYYLTTEKLFLDETVVLIWRTTPTVTVGKSQSVYDDVNSNYIEKHNVTVARRMSGSDTIYTDLGGWQVTLISKQRKSESSAEEFQKLVRNAIDGVGVESVYSRENGIFIEDCEVCRIVNYEENGFDVSRGVILYGANLDEIEWCTTKHTGSYGNISNYMEEPVSMLDFKGRLAENFVNPEKDTIRLTQKEIFRIREIAETLFMDEDFIYGGRLRAEGENAGNNQTGNVEESAEVII